MSEILTSDYKMFKLSITDLSFLYITIDFSVSGFPLFQIYKIINFETPVSAESNDSTRLIFKDDYLLVSKSENLYTTVDKEFINSCKKDYIRVCEETKELSHLNESSCIIELYKGNNLTKIKDVCEFKYSINAIKPKIVESPQQR